MASAASSTRDLTAEGVVLRVQPRRQRGQLAELQIIGDT
jgi:hypothetical protein